MVCSVAHSSARGLDSDNAISCDVGVQCALHSVVSLLPDWPPGLARNEEPEGSGIIIGDGTIVATADHVLGAAKSARIRTFSGQILATKIVLRNKFTDIALLKIEKDLRPFQMGGPLSIPDKTCAMGNSFGLDISTSCGVVSAVQVSGVGFNRIEDFIQTDAAVNPGMSGGALVDKDGKLVGMLSAIFTKQSDANIGVNFAVSTELLTKVLNQYQAYGKVKFPQPGILLKPTTSAGEVGYIGGEVVRVVAGSPESRSGIQVGDIVLSLGDRRIKRAGSYEAAIALAETGKKIELQVLRNDKPVTLEIILDKEI